MKADKNATKINNASPEIKTLLHVCCAPCAVAPFSDFHPDSGITGFFYNPNIYPESELGARLAEVKKISEIYDIPCIFMESEYSEFLNYVAGLENEKEGGARCARCFELRLSKAFEYASAHGFGAVGTTLSSSPHKNVKTINAIGNKLAAATPGVRFMEYDFKKNDGFKRSVELCAKFTIYRQKYCGCEFARSHLKKS